MDRLFKFIFLAGLAAFHAALMWVIWDKFPAPITGASILTSRPWGGWIDLPRICRY